MVHPNHSLEIYPERLGTGIFKAAIACSAGEYSALGAVGQSFFVHENSTKAFNKTTTHSAIKPFIH